MKTINSLSGGKTSSYVAVHYPADYNLFALVRTSDPRLKFPDAKVRQMVSDRIGKEFIGTLEMDEIIYTMFDLEQYIGQEIIWLSADTFEEVIKKHGNYLPCQYTRYCTADLKVFPIAQWCYQNTDLPIEMRIGFRANELNRAESMIKREVKGIEHYKFKVGEKNGRNQWKELPYRRLRFPLIEDVIFSDTIQKYWKDKNVRFAKYNNCVGCFHQNPILLNKRANDRETDSAKKFDWFMMQEVMTDKQFGTIPYHKIKSHRMQMELFDEDFSDCDTGYCGL